MFLAVDDHGGVGRGAERLRRLPSALTPAAVPATAAAWCLATVPAIAAAGAGGTTHAGASTTAFVASVAATVTLLAAGTAAWLRPPTRPLGGLVLILATAWMAPLWTGWVAGPGLLRSVGEVVAPLVVPAVVHLCLADSAGHLGSPARRLFVQGVWTATALVTVVRAVIRDPLLDPHCWSNCTDAVFLVQAVPTAVAVLDTAWHAVAVVACLVGAVTGVVTVTRTDENRRIGVAAQPVLVPAMATALVLAAWLLALTTSAPELPGREPFRMLHLLAAVALVGVAAATASAVLRSARLARRLDRLVDDLATAPRPGSVQSWLADTLDDSGLTVLYRRPGTGSLVDATGAAAPLPTSPGDTSVAVVRDDEELAVVLHGRGAAGTALLRGRLGAAARLVIDNERLRAELLAQLHELRRSRARLVDSADGERRALERDLHDAAQQRLLAALHRLDRARAAGPTHSVLPGLVAEAEALVAEVRDFAHGLFPAVLEQAGLSAALETLGDTAHVPLLVEFEGPETPLPRAVARAAYAMVATTVQAPRRGEAVRVRVEYRDGALVVAVSGASISEPEVLETGGASWIDRVEAVGGCVDVTADGWRAELPCALP